jgi:hypothetical protein
MNEQSSVCDEFFSGKSFQFFFRDHRFFDQELAKTEKHKFI